MADLRAIFEALRFANVETFIASGNVIFDAPGADAPGLESSIEERLQKKLGYAVSTFLRTPAELHAAIASPCAALDEGAHALWVGFVKTAPAPDAKARLLALASEADGFHFVGREIYWRRTVKVSESKLTGARLERALAGPSTFRNITTVRKLATKLAAK
jgi:uncharacterized protein (DUF1697 family)